MAELWISGSKAAYLGVLRFLGVGPFRFPFLDLYGLLAAVKCAQQGIDVYLWNPCDVLGRVHDYSPLWLTLMPGFLGTGDTLWLGAAFDLVFLLALSVALRPRSAGESVLYALAALSPMTLFALERANVDLVIFVLLLGASILYHRSRNHRYACYGLVLLAGLLKYYPLALLALIARERGRAAIPPVLVTSIALAAFGIYDHHEILTTIEHVPSGGYFTNTFAARNLFSGLAGLTGGRAISAPAAYLAAAVFIAYAAVLASRNFRLLETSVREPTDGETSRLAIGSLLLTACFFAGTNADYRGIFLLFVVPGLVRLHRSDHDPIRRWAARVIAAVLFVMWEEFFRIHIDGALRELATPSLRAAGMILFWFGRELVWWWLIAALAAITAASLRRLPLFERAFAGLRSPPSLGVHADGR